jgi:predicted transcriptional regulator
MLLQLLDLIEPLKRGLIATEEDQEQIESVVQQLERMNPTSKPLASPLLNGRWRLVRA